MFQRMDSQFLMTLEDDEIVPVALMVTEKQVLAMSRIYLLPIFQGKFDGRKRRMGMEFIAEAMLLKKLQDFGDSRVIHHLLRLFA